MAWKDASCCQEGHVGCGGASITCQRLFKRLSKWRVDGDLNGKWLLLFYGLVLIKEKFIGCVWVITCGNSLLLAFRHSKVPQGSLTLEHCRGFQLMVRGKERSLGKRLSQDWLIFMGKIIEERQETFCEFFLSSSRHLSYCFWLKGKYCRSCRPGLSKIPLTLQVYPFGNEPIRSSWKKGEAKTWNLVSCKFTQMLK